MSLVRASYMCLLPSLRPQGWNDRPRNWSCLQHESGGKDLVRIILLDGSALLNRI